MRLTRPARRGRLVATWALACLVAAAQAGADDRAQVLELRAEDLAAQDRCPEAIRAIDEARERGAADARLLLVRGQCEIRLGRYPEATATLEEVRGLDPELGDADLYLGIARYHAGDLDGAANALEAARGRTTQEAELELYTGLVLMQRAEHREAALALERARTAGAGRVEPAASYYAGLAWAAAEDRQRAREAFDRVRDHDPDGTWSARAEEAMAASQPPGRSWATVTAGIEYDTNVVLLGDQPLPGFGFTDDDDGRGVWTLEGGAELFRTADWSGGLLASYTGTAQFELDQFDTHYPVGTLWVDREFGGSTTARLRYDIGYAWVGYDPYLFSQDVTGLVWHDWGTPGETEYFLGYYYDGFRYDVFPCGRLEEGGPRDFPSDCLFRNGHGVRAGVEHRIPVPDVGTDTSVRSGFQFDRFWSQGTEFDSYAYEFNLGFATMLPLDILLDIEGSYTYQPYDNASFFPWFATGGRAFIERDDHVFQAGVYLSRSFGRHLSLSTRYWFRGNNSNVFVYDYTRHVVGGYVTVFIR